MSKTAMGSSKQVRPNYVYTILSMALVLCLLGLFGLWLLQAAYLGKSLKENIDVLVELRDETPPIQRENLTARLGAYAFVRPGSVRFRSKEEALEEMGDEVNRDIVELDLPNPFRDMLIFNVVEEQMQPDSLAAIAALIKQQEAAVLGVFYQEQLVDGFIDNAKRLAYIFLALAAFLVLIVVVLIHNTVRLSLYANRFLIKTQQLVGADWSFITRPYLRRAFWQGLVSGLVAVGLVMGVQWWLQEQVPELRLFDQQIYLGLLYATIIVLGILISWLSHWVVVRRYLSMRVDDLY